MQKRQQCLENAKSLLLYSLRFFLTKLSRCVFISRFSRECARKSSPQQHPPSRNPPCRLLFQILRKESHETRHVQRFEFVLVRIERFPYKPRPCGTRNVLAISPTILSPFLTRLLRNLSFAYWWKCCGMRFSFTI